VIFYYGIDLVRVYWKYYRLKDEMSTAALFAPTRSDTEIHRQLSAVARELELPVEATRFRIQRIPTPKSVRISTQYRVTIELPFHHRVIQFRPDVTVRQH
jgi:hypothetical protein